ncbi:WecB/TagA/CpsF family glycosyltransferase [Vibrio cyclitrophicus]
MTRRSSKAYSFINPYSYNYFLDNEAVKNFSGLYIDGQSLVFAFNFFNANKVERASFDFSSIADPVFKHAVNNNYELSIIGGTQSDIELAVNNIKIRYPGINVSFYRNGYFSSDKERVETLRKISRTDLLIIGMGTPYQEDYAILAKSMLDKAFIVTCGGFLSQTAFKADYYSPLVKKLGIRWLQRAIRHKYVRQRLIKDYPIFFLKYIKNRMSK